MNDQSLLAPKPKPAAPLACSWSLPVIVTPKLQALVYDILPWRKMPESDARSVCYSYTPLPVRCLSTARVGLLLRRRRRRWLTKELR